MSTINIGGFDAHIEENILGFIHNYFNLCHLSVRTIRSDGTGGVKGEA